MSVTDHREPTGPAALGPAAERPDTLAVQPAGALAPTREQVAATLDRSVRALLAGQDRQGWWKGELATNVTMEAEDLLMRHVLGLRDPQLVAETARWIRSQQHPDGMWATFEGGPGDLSTTVEAYVALRLAGDPADSPHLQRAAGRVRAMGGLPATRVFTRIWLAVVGLWSWEELPALPPELIDLPAWFPLNIYDWACWARQTVVPLTVVSALRVRFPLGFEVPELTAEDGGRAAPRSPWFSVAGAFERGDLLLRRYHRRPAGRWRRRAMRRCEQWVVERQEADGSWGGIQPPWVYSILALHALGHSLDSPVLSRALAGLDSFTVHEQTPAGRVRRLEACQSPVWDTALAVVGLRDAGLPGDHGPVAEAVRWMVEQEVRRPGDWAVRRPGVPASGWAFEFANEGYPDVDDTAEVVLAMLGAPGTQEPVRRGVDWVLQMQCRDGGWAAFDVDNTSRLCAALPFCDFGAVTDPPSADVTAHVVEMLAKVLAGSRPEAADPRVLPALRRGVSWLLAAQEQDGSWFGRWGANYVYGVGAVVPALVAAGLPAGHPALRRAVAWLHDHQNGDGGWGEDLRSYRDRSWSGRGTSTASQTAWALLALLAVGDRGSGTQAALGWLTEQQKEDGTWDEPQFTGTGFPGDFYINYHLYRMVFPVTALARAVHGTGPAAR